MDAYGLPLSYLLRHGRKDYPNAVFDIPGLYAEAREAGWSPIQIAKIIGEAIKEVEGEEFASEVLHMLLIIEKRNNWPIKQNQKPDIFGT